MKPDEMLQYLLRDSGLTPVSRYGRNSQECAPVAVAVAVILSGETGEPLTTTTLDYVMGLVVNDHADIGYMIRNYGEPYGYSASEFLPEADRNHDRDDHDHDHDWRT